MGWVKSKTIWFSFLLIILGAIQEHLDIIQPLLTPDVYGIVLQVVGLIVAVLRVVTTSSLSNK